MDQVKTQMPFVLFGKLFLILLTGLVFSYYLEKDQVRDYQKGAALTREKYLADYETYKADLMDYNDQYPWLVYPVVLVMVGVFFGAYELAGWLFGRVFRYFFPPDHFQGPIRI